MTFCMYLSVEIGCICDEGWLGVDCDKDKNECQSTQNLCVGENVRCKNTLGSYKCQCETGFHDISGSCQGTYMVSSFCFLTTHPPPPPPPPPPYCRKGVTLQTWSNKTCISNVIVIRLRV